MPKVAKKAQVPYTPEQMYALVHDVAKYPEFVGACSAGEVLSANEAQIQAKLSFAKGAIKQSFTTCNTLFPFREIQMELVDGPFKTLSGSWCFEAVENGCEVCFHLEFEFDNLMLKLMLQPIFQQVIGEMLKAFCQRASDVYG